MRLIATLPDNETARLDALRRYEIVDTDPDPAFDDLTRLAAHLCGAPIALISFVEETSQWFKAKIGLNVCRTPRDVSFCAHTILREDILVIPDAAADPRFADIPWVTGEPRVRFYAGTPLLTPDGHKIGSLCVLDRVSRALTGEQRDALQALARQVVSQLELRRSLGKRAQAEATLLESSYVRDLSAWRHTEDDLRRAQDELERRVEERTAQLMQVEAQYSSLFENAVDGIFLTSPDGRYLAANPALARLYGYDSPAELMADLSASALYVDPGRREEFARLMREYDTVSEFESPVRRKDGTVIWISESARAVRDVCGEIVRYEGMVVDVTDRWRAEEALRESEERYRGLVEHSPEAIVVYCEYQLVYVNAAAVRLFGAGDTSALLGRSVFDLVHPDFHALARERARRTQLEGQPSPLIEQTYVRLDGTVVDVEAVSTSVAWEGKRAGQVLIRDITERKQTQRQLEESRQRYRSLFHHNPDAVFSLDLDGRFLSANGSCEPLSGYSRQELLEMSFLPLVAPEDLERTHAHFRLACRGEAQNFEVALARRDGARRDLQVSAVPIFVSGEVVGIYGIAKDVTESQWAEREIRSLNAQLEQRLGHITVLNGELTQAYEATIEGWSRALDLRDKETEGHCQRVTDLTARLAQAFGIGRADLIHIRRGALLHDIGKMGIPDSILLKPGPLTAEERTVMERHPDYARAMLAPIEFLRPALDIPYGHHERWDGRGYPQGLRGEQIPLAARLFAIVDVWDALRSDRPYRGAWSIEKTRDHLLALAGSHFDPEVVPAFLEIVGLREGAEPSLRLAA